MNQDDINRVTAAVAAQLPAFSSDHDRAMAALRAEVRAAKSKGIEVAAFEKHAGAVVASVHGYIARCVRPLADRVAELERRAKSGPW